MKRINSQKGQALILIALAVVGLVGFTALTIDGGRVLSDRRNAQNTADTSVLAAALEKTKPTGIGFVAAAKNRATNNGYTDGVDGTKVEVVLCNAAPDPCQGLPATGAVPSEYIRVRIHSFVQTTFARVLGRAQVENTVEAIARVQGSTSSSGGSLFNGSSMVATQSGNVDNCLYLNGNAVVNVHNSGILINCSGTKSIYMNTGATVNMDAQGQTAGCDGGNPPYNLSPTTCHAAAQTINASTFASVPTADDPTPTCSGNGTVTGVSPNGSPPNPIINSGTATFSEGNFSGFTLNSGTITFNPGVYCFSGNLTINGGTLSGPTLSPPVKFVFQNQGVKIGSGQTWDFKNLEFFGNDATLTVDGTLRADRLRFFSKGSQNKDVFTVDAGGKVSSLDAYLYLKSGNINWNSNNTIDLSSAVAPDTYAGLLIYKPWGNSSTIIFNKDSTMHLVGTFLVPSSPINFNSGVNFDLHSQFIAYNYNVNDNSGGGIDIWYQASENYGGGSPDDPTIELTK